MLVVLLLQQRSAVKDRILCSPLLPLRGVVVVAVKILMEPLEALAAAQDTIVPLVQVIKVVIIRQKVILAELVMAVLHLMPVVVVARELLVVTLQEPMLAPEAPV